MFICRSCGDVAVKFNEIYCSKCSYAIRIQRFYRSKGPYAKTRRLNLKPTGSVSLETGARESCLSHYDTIPGLNTKIQTIIDKYPQTQRLKIMMLGIGNNQIQFDRNTETSETLYPGVSEIKFLSRNHSLDLLLVDILEENLRGALKAKNHLFFRNNWSQIDGCLDSEYEKTLSRIAFKSSVAYDERFDFKKRSTPPRVGKDFSYYDVRDESISFNDLPNHCTSTLKQDFLKLQLPSNEFHLIVSVYGLSYALAPLNYYVRIAILRKYLVSLQIGGSLVVEREGVMTGISVQEGEQGYEWNYEGIEHGNIDDERHRKRVASNQYNLGRIWPEVEELRTPYLNIVLEKRSQYMVYTRTI